MSKVRQATASVGENKMGVMPVNKLLVSMAAPIVVSMVIQALYNIVDSLYVAKISETQFEFTAISLALAAQNFMIAVATGTGTGINALLSKSLGEGDTKKANKIAANGVFLALCSYIFFAILGFFCVDPYMRLMTDNETVIGFGKQYLSICMITSFGLFGEIVMERLMTSTGRTMLTMITQAVGAIINIILDPIFIFTFGLGIRGAAIATVIGQICAFVLAIFLNKFKNRDIHLTFRKFKPSGRIIWNIYSVGIPSIIMASIGSVMNVLFNSILNSAFGVIIGDYAQKSFGAYFKLQSFIFMPIFGLNNGIVPIVAYNYGAAKKKRMVKTAFLGIAYATGYMLLGLLVFELFPEFLLSFFIESEEAMGIGINCMRIVAISFIFAGFAIVAGSVFQALGRGVFSMTVSIVRQLVVLVPVAFLLSRFGDVDLVWWSFPIAEVASVLVSLIFFIYSYKKIISKIPDEC